MFSFVQKPTPAPCCFNSVQANIVNQTEGLQDFRHRNALVRLVNDDCTSLHAQSQGLHVLNKSPDVNLCQYISETVHDCIFLCPNALRAFVLVCSKWMDQEKTRRTSDNCRWCLAYLLHLLDTCCLPCLLWRSTSLIDCHTFVKVEDPCSELRTGPCWWCHLGWSTKVLILQSPISQCFQSILRLLSAVFGF